MTDVLIVDDEVDNAELLRQLLELAGHRVRVAQAGHDALALLAQAPADVVLVDLGLPDVDGCELAREIRARLPSSRIAAVTGRSDEDTRAAALRAGCDAFIVKPVRVPQLLALLDRGAAAVELPTHE